MNEELVLHIGLHKTGTSFLQKQVFPKLEGVDFITPVPRNISKNMLIDIELSKDKITLISDEGLTRFNYLNLKQDSMKSIASRIHKLYPEAKIIFVTRNKNDWLKSLYSEYFKRKNIVNYYGKNNENTLLTYDEWFETIFQKQDLEIDEYIKYIEELFNEVLILKYEELKKDPEKFIKKICDFIGVDAPLYKNKIVNKKISEKHTNFLSKINRTFRKTGIPLFFYFPIEEVIKKINER